MGFFVALLSNSKSSHLQKCWFLEEKKLKDHQFFGGPVGQTFDVEIHIIKVQNYLCFRPFVQPLKKLCEDAMLILAS